MTPCPQCGAAVPGEESCADRFAVLLALDHSRQEPWGSRHGIAFAVYTLQHAEGITQSVLANCWLMLSLVYQAGNDRLDVVKGLRATYRGKHEKSYRKSNNSASASWNNSAFPKRLAPPRHYPVTIASLGDFAAESYPAQLDTWCQATLRTWSEPE